MWLVILILSKDHKIYKIVNILIPLNGIVQRFKKDSKDFIKPSDIVKNVWGQSTYTDIYKYFTWKYRVPVWYIKEKSFWKII